MARITAFNVGYCNHLACVAYRGAGLKTHLFPAQAFLVETRSGPYLWDTGFGRHFADGCRGSFRLVGLLTPARYDEARDSLVLKLRSAGLAVRDLRGIVLSHLHPDHMAAVRDFPDIPLFAAYEALETVCGREGLRALQVGYMPSLMPADADTRMRIVESLPTVRLPPELAPFTQGWALSDTGDFIAVPLPGHAAGHLGAFVRTDEGWTLIASDAAWAHEAYRTENGMPSLTLKLQLRPAEYLNTLQALAQLERQGVRILISHEAGH